MQDGPMWLYEGKHNKEVENYSLMNAVTDYFWCSAEKLKELTEQR
jgi:hypothetical protein